MDLTYFRNMTNLDGFPLSSEAQANFNIECRDDEDGILLLLLTGRWTNRNAASLENEMSRLVKEHSATRVLADISALKGRLGVVDCYLYVQRLPSDSRACKTAFLDLPENLENDSFLQITAENRGFPVRCFTSRAEAMKWLKE